MTREKDNEKHVRYFAPSDDQTKDRARFWYKLSVDPCDDAGHFVGKIVVLYAIDPSAACTAGTPTQNADTKEEALKKLISLIDNHHPDLIRMPADEEEAG